MERLKSPQVHAAATQIVSELTWAEQALNADDSVGVNHYFPHIEQPLIGREAEIIHLQSLLGEGNRLITVLGIGGTGKTFFVRSQHAQLQTHFGDAIYYVDLRSAAAQGEPVPAAAPGVLGQDVQLGVHRPRLDLPAALAL